MLGAVLILMWRSGDAMPWRLFRLARYRSGGRAHTSAHKGALVR